MRIPSPSPPLQRLLFFIAALALVALIGYADYITDWEWSLFVFYAFPILLFARRGDLRLAILTAMLCGIAWFWANQNSHPYRTTSGYAWASLNRLAYFVFVAIGGTALHNQREEMRARLRAMQRAQALEHEIVRVSEREQMRIGQDLHDGLCQQLAAIDCAAACLKADLETEARPEARAADTIQQMLRDAVLEARSLARGISPVHADADDLPAVLEELAEKTNQTEAVTATFTQIGEVQRMDPQTALHLYRIAQEAVRNALKHAQASRIEIELQEGASLKVSVTDNGRGFTRTSTSKGMGVGTMRYRARLIGAALDIAQRDGGGTIVTCTLPLPVSARAESALS